MGSLFSTHVSHFVVQLSLWLNYVISVFIMLLIKAICFFFLFTDEHRQTFFAEK